jgi:hypothetical protein
VGPVPDEPPEPPEPPVAAINEAVFITEKRLVEFTTPLKY